MFPHWWSPSSFLVRILVARATRIRTQRVGGGGDVRGGGDDLGAEAAAGLPAEALDGAADADGGEHVAVTAERPAR